MSHHLSLYNKKKIFLMYESSAAPRWVEKVINEITPNIVYIRSRYELNISNKEEFMNKHINKQTNSLPVSADQYYNIDA